MKAAEEMAQVLAKGDPMGQLCNMGIKVMEWGSDVTGLTYYQINILILYVIEPLLLFLTLFLIYWKLIRKNDSTSNRIIWSCILIVSLMALLKILVPILSHSNWEELGFEKVKDLQTLGVVSGTNYAIVNLFLFVVFFLVAFFGNLIYLKLCNKKAWLRAVSYVYWIPFVGILLIGWAGKF